MANIKKHLDNIKGALYGKDVRSSIHDGIDAINKEVENTTGRQVDLENTFDQLVINAGNSNAEIVDARVKNDGTSYSKLGDRLDAVDSQLEHIESNNNNFVLYSFFRENKSPAEVDLYISADGENLQRINSLPVLDGRDPSIIYKDGEFLIACTGYNPHDFVIYKSADLANWTRHTIICGIYNSSVANRIWAPEWFEDDNGDLYILLSVRVGQENDIDGNSIPNFRPYIIKCNNVKELSFGEPRMLNLEDRNKIDHTIIKENEIYHLFIKDEYDKFIEHWTSLDLTNWDKKSDAITELGNYIEGASIVKYNNKFYLYGDNFSGDKGLIYYTTSIDLNTWSERRLLNSGSNRLRHGTAYVVKDSKAKNIISKYKVLNGLIPNNNTRSLGVFLGDIADSSNEIHNLEIVDKMVYIVRNNESLTVKSFINIGNAKEFYVHISSDSKGEVKFDTDMSVVSVPTNYLISAEHGDGDVLIKFEYCDYLRRFKPTSSVNTRLITKKSIKKPCWKTVTLSTQTIDALDVEDCVCYKVAGGNYVTINGISDNKESGTRFYLMLASGGSGSITVNSGENITVPGGSFVITTEKGRNDVLFEFIKVDASTFRLRQ